MLPTRYDENCLDSAMDILGEAFDYAVRYRNLTADYFMDIFISTGYAKMFEDGNPKVILGCSGIELVLNVLNKVGVKYNGQKSIVDYYISSSYWAGWIIAYFQWKTGLSFDFIHKYISMEEVIKLYNPLHEASEDRAVDSIKSIIKSRMNSTRLQYYRKLAGLSQSELSKKSGVNLRTLQEYELGTKDINKASALKVYSLALALNCSVEDILELL